MIDRLRAVPWGVALFLGYAFVILAGLGLALRYVIDLAIAAPVSLPGVVVMILLAWTIFTITLVLQRKAAARGFALGLSSLTLPTIGWFLLLGLPVFALFFAALAGLLFRGLRQSAVAGWLDQA
ncbi:MAG TPA: hypothetical protein VEX41_09275 [Candidatus Eisenbacteria bacterium]|nr:hypothetical protein [Candidatus Eisenbacteria bacterium]